MEKENSEVAETLKGVWENGKLKKVLHEELLKMVYQCGLGQCRIWLLTALPIFILMTTGVIFRTHLISEHIVVEATVNVVKSQFRTEEVHGPHWGGQKDSKR